MNNSKTYCKYPFKQIAIKDFQNDKLKSFWPCCMMGNQIDDESMNRLGIENVHLLTPDEMYNHPRMTQLRNNLLNNVRDPACKVCWQQEEKGLKSFREFSHDDEMPEGDGLSMIDLTASNICNLQCRMCTPSASHQLMKDYGYFEKNNLMSTVESTIKRFHKSEVLRITESPQWDWLMNNTHQIKVIRASGGEPFYDNKVIQLLEKYVETGAAKNTILHFHTNATQFTDDVVKLLQEFKSNKHTFSVDGYGKIYEYVRYPATFEQLQTSISNYINKLTNYDPILNFTMVVNAYNVLNIQEYAFWTYQLSDKPSVVYSECYPMDRGISLIHMPIRLLKVAKDRIIHVLKNSPSLNNIHLENLITQVDFAINNNKENKKKMLDEIMLFDLSRNQSYKDFLDPLLVEWLSNE